MPEPTQRPARRRRRDWGRAIALALCLVFAVVGAVPLLLGFLARTEAVRAWASRETAAFITRELGLAARYSVEVRLWPMQVTLAGLVVDASDGGGPFLEVERVSVHPRPFSLLAGKLDAGDVEIVGPRVRAVVRGGALQNLALTLPETSGESEGPARAPFASLSITDAHVDAVVDGLEVAARELDLDVSSEARGTYEIALRAGPTRVTHTHPFPGREGTEDMVDEDRICRLDARLRVEPDAVVVRRLTLFAAADFDPDPGTAPPCQLTDGDWRAVELRLGALRIGLPKEGETPSVHGRVRAKVPAALAHRFVAIPHATGSIALDVEIDHDGRARLPDVTGRLHAESPGIDGKVFGRDVAASLVIRDGAVSLANVGVTFADGSVAIEKATLEPFEPGMKLTVGAVDLRGLEFTGLMRDLGIHPQTHVAWTIKEGRFDHFGGTLDPLALEGPVSLKTRDFEIFDKPVKDATRKHMIGVKEALVRGNFVVRPSLIAFSQFTIDTPRSHLRTTVNLDLREKADIEVFEGTRVDLADISPLAAVPVGGVATLTAESHGPFGEPKITGSLAVKDFMLGGFQAGDIESARVAFVPLVLELFDARVKKNGSRLRAPVVRVAFDKGPDVLVDADLDTREPPHLGIRDFFEVFRFDEDPRFESIAGTAVGTARVHYALGGVEDRCGGGYLKVKAKMAATDVALFGETYDGGSADIDYEWDDQAAGDAGMNIDVRSAVLRKGAGTLLGSARVRHGAKVDGSAIATGIPLATLDMLGAAGKLFDGQLSAVANVTGTLGALEALADVSLSRVRIGPDSLPPSRFRFTMEPAPEAPRPEHRTRCGNRRATPFDPGELARDVSAGLFRVTGQLFDGQIGLDDVRLTRQRHAIMMGKVVVSALDLGTLSNLIPGIAFAETAPTGKLSATIDVASLPLDRLKDADVSVTLGELSVARGGYVVSLGGSTGPLRLRGDELSVPDLRLVTRASSGMTASLVVGGALHRVAADPELDFALRLEPLALADVAAGIPAIARASGTAEASLRVTGPPAAPRYDGSARVRGGELDLRDPRVSLDGIEIDVDVGGGEARVTRAVANIGSGTIAMKAVMPLRGLVLGTATASITARGVKAPLADGMNMTADADLEATFQPFAGPDAEGGRNVPAFEGTIALTSFSYTRPISLKVDLGQLAGRARRTEVESYDPQGDLVRFNVNVVSPRPLRFKNNLVDMEIEVERPGLVLSGTNQRYGARGMLRILEDSKLQLRNNEFEVRDGYVRFDDPSRIAPVVDVRAVTEYRRYASSASSDAPGAEANGGGGGAAAAGGSTGGQWRIQLHASGDVQDLKVDFTSDPPLGQEDIVLLLTLGTTRAEIDRGLATSLGETVGLEALSALTGADKAVRTIVPIIDDFRFGTAYSSRSGRIEPTVTLGKRVTNDVRATVTTGLSASREVRSSVEWRLNRRMSVQGSYDNANDASSSSVGNVGADLRLRLEFE